MRWRGLRANPASLSVCRPSGLWEAATCTHKDNAVQQSTSTTNCGCWWCGVDSMCYVQLVTASLYCSFLKTTLRSQPALSVADPQTSPPALPLQRERELANKDKYNKCNRVQVLQQQTAAEDVPFFGGQIFQSLGLVSIDRSVVAALLSTTPRLTPRSSANDLAPLH